MIEEIRDGLMEKIVFEQVLQNQAWVEWGNIKMGGQYLKWCLRQINAADKSSWKARGMEKLFSAFCKNLDMV